MQIDAVDFFYLAMPQIRSIGDGSQDALLVRVRAGDFEGWGECEAAPLVSIAGYVCPMSHSACYPVQHSVQGQTLETVEDIRRINALVRRQSFDMLQVDHVLSGIDIALWDLLGKRYGVPVYRLLGYDRAYPKEPYASLLFGDTPEETYEKGVRVRAGGYRAAKFGWGPYGAGTIEADVAQVEAARAGIGPDIKLLVDAGTVWVDDLEKASERVASLEKVGASWLEEPFVSGALKEYKALSGRTTVPLAAGEGAHNPYQAMHLIDYGGIRYVQIDTGRIGGITSAFEIARYAQARGITYVNHTFTTKLAVSASVQPFAGIENDRICEFPVEATPLANDLTMEPLEMDSDGLLYLPDRPGLGLTPNPETIRRYLQKVEIRVNDTVLYSTPEI